MLKRRPSFVYEDASTPTGKTWIWHAAMFTYVFGWLAAWAALSVFNPVFRLLFLLSLPAAALVLWTWFTDDEN